MSQTTPWSQPASDVCRGLSVDPAVGLSSNESARRLVRHGKNQLRQVQPRRASDILLAQVRSLIVLLLAAAMVVSFAFGQWLEGLAVLSVLLVNTAVGFATELRAVRSMESLRALGATRCTVRRNGALRAVDAVDLCRGDILIVEAGDVVTADARLVLSSRLQVDESLLTGESLPTSKRVEPVGQKVLLAERKSMLYKGTAITRGSAEAVVVATGMLSELGRISSLVASAKDERTPLEERLNKLGRALVWVTVAVTAFVVASGLLTGKPLLLVVQTAIALAVGAIPEGLPVIATIALARGMRRMYRQKALVNRLAAVETLGAVTVICTDKTGTLTHNQLALSDVHAPSGDPRLALELGALCNNAALGAEGAVGDPLEVALLRGAFNAGIDRQALRRAHPRVGEVAFDSELKLMATLHASGLAAVKGAPERVLKASARVWGPRGCVPLESSQRQALLQANDALAGRGLRVLGVARRALDPDALQSPAAFAYTELEFVALVALHDPPRPEVRAAIGACRAAGIRVVMVTGDQAATARSISLETGVIHTAWAPVVMGADIAATPDSAAEFLNANVFCRVSPEQKLELVARYQAAGEVVAMMGDGVNDAPALRKAEIGVAMGSRGTEVAREAADMVLLDDRFGTVVEAVEQGRVIFDNIRAFVVYLLSCNLAEILVITVATLVGAALPLLPLQILYLNLLTDVFPALALGVSEGGEDVMKRPPRDPGEAIVDRARWTLIVVYGAVITAAVLIAFFWSGQSVTVSFLTLALAQLWHVFAMRPAGAPVLRNGITRNPWVFGAIILCLGLLALATYLPPLAAVLGLAPPSAGSWALIAGCSLAPVLVIQIIRSFSPV